MPEGLLTAEGTRVDIPPITGEFASLQAAQAQAADDQAAADEHAAPPKKDPEAPYGRKADGTPKKGPGGRPAKHVPKAEQPRVTEAPAADGQQRDYSEPLAELADAVWVSMAMAPYPTLEAQAALWKAHKPGLVAGFNVAAQNNGRIRRLVEKSEKVTWVLALAGAVLPLVQQSIQLWTNPAQELEEGSGRTLVGELAAATRRDLADMARAQAEAMVLAAQAA